MPSYTADEIIRAIQKTSGNVSAAARALGCSRQTIANYIKKHPTVEQALKDEREALIDAAESALHSAILDKQGWAVCFTLKTLGKDRGYSERHEISGPDGGPIANEHHLPQSTVDSLRDFIKRKSDT